MYVHTVAIAVVITVMATVSGNATSNTVIMAPNLNISLIYLRLAST